MIAIITAYFGLLLWAAGHHRLAPPHLLAVGALVCALGCIVMAAQVGLAR